MERGYNMTAKTITINISENQEQLLKEINAEGIHHSSKNPILNDVIDNICAELNSDKNTIDKLNTYKITRTQTIIDYQTVVSTSEDAAYSCLQDDGWEDEVIDTSDSSIELINGGN